MEGKATQRILVFATNYLPHIGGAELAFHEVAIRIPEVTFDLITSRLKDPFDPKKLLPSEEKFKNVNIYRVGSGFNLAKLVLPKSLYPIAAYNKATELYKKFGPYKKIYALQASQGGGAAWLFKIFNPEVTLILNLQEGKDFKKQGSLINFFRSLIIKKADAIVAISSYLKEYAKKINKKSKIHVIPNGVDIGHFSTEYSYGELSGLSDQLGIKPGDKVIVSVSRLVPKNGIDILVEAFAEVCKLKNKSYKLLLLGDGPEKENLKSQIASLKLENQVIFAGTVGHAELPKYLKISDVFVRSSRSEGLGSSFLEAMSAGVPVIGTRVGGIPDFLKDRETGLFCKTDDPEDLAEKIQILLNDDTLYKKLSENGKKLVE